MTDEELIAVDRKAFSDCRRAGLKPFGHYSQKRIQQAFARLDAMDREREAQAKN